MRFHHCTMFVCCGLALHCCVCLLWGDTTLLCLFAVNFSTLLSLFAMRWHHFVVFFCCEVRHCYICFLWSCAFVCNIVVFLGQEVEQHYVAVFVCHDVAPRCWICLSLNGTALFGTRMMTDTAFQPRCGQERNKNECSNSWLFVIYTLYFLLVEIKKWRGPFSVIYLKGRVLLSNHRKA